MHLSKFLLTVTSTFPRVVLRKEAGSTFSAVHTWWLIFTSIYREWKLSILSPRAMRLFSSVSMLWKILFIISRTMSFLQSKKQVNKYCEHSWNFTAGQIDIRDVGSKGKALTLMMSVCDRSVGGFLMLCFRLTPLSQADATNKHEGKS